MIIDRPTPATQNGLENVIRGWPKWMFCKAFKKHKLCSSWSNIYILAPTKHYIQPRSAWTSHLEPCLTCPIPTFANQYVEYMNKVEMSRHLYILNSSPSPEKQYLEQTKEWASWVFRNLQFRDPTLQYLEHVIIVGILSHCYDFFPFPPALYKPLRSTYDPTWHLESFLKYYPLNFWIYWTHVNKWSKLTCRVRVINIFFRFRRYKTICWTNKIVISSHF